MFTSTYHTCPPTFGRSDIQVSIQARRYLKICGFSLSAAKKVWKKIVSRYFLKTGRKTIRKIDFPSLSKQLIEQAFTKRQCVAGFTRCGLWPFDGEAMAEKVAKKVQQSGSTDSPTVKYDLIERLIDLHLFSFQFVQPCHCR